MQYTTANILTLGGAMYTNNLLMVILLCGISQASHADTLKKKDVLNLISGKSATWQTEDGKIKGTIAWAADGSQSVSGNFSGFDSDSGTWRIKGADVCSTWTKIRKGKEQCNPFEDLGGGKYKSGKSIIQF